MELVEEGVFLYDVNPSGSSQIYNTICTNIVDERKLTKIRMLKTNNFLLYHNWTNKKNKKAVMFINFAMYRGVCVCL